MHADLHNLERTARNSHDLEVLYVGFGYIALKESAGTAVSQADGLP